MLNQPLKVNDGSTLYMQACTAAERGEHLLKSFLTIFGLAIRIKYTDGTWTLRFCTDRIILLGAILAYWYL